MSIYIVTNVLHCPMTTVCYKKEYFVWESVCGWTRPKTPESEKEPSIIQCDRGKNSHSHLNKHENPNYLVRPGRLLVIETVSYFKSVSSILPEWSVCQVSSCLSACSSLQPAVGKVFASTSALRPSSPHCSVRPPPEGKSGIFISRQPARDGQDLHFLLLPAVSYSLSQGHKLLPF